MEIKNPESKNKHGEYNCPKGWKIVKIGDHFNFKNGLNKAKEFFGSGTPIVNYMDVYPHPERYAKDIQGKVTVSKDELRAFEIKKGDVLFTRTSETIDEIGLTSTIMDDVKNTVFSGFLLRARPITELFQLEFKKYCFRSPLVRKQIISTSSQTTRALTNGRLLSKVILPIPLDSSEQLSIATSISDVEKLCDELELLISKKKNIKQGAMQELLTGKRRLQGFTKDWSRMKLKEIVKIPITDGPHLTPKFHQNGIPFLSVNNIVDNILDFSNLRYISQQDHLTFSKKCKPQKGDILFGKAASVGQAAIINVDFELNIWSPLALIRINDENVTKFIYYFIQSHEITKQINFLTNSSSQGNIGMGDIEKLEFLLPLKKEQITISQILSDIDSEIHELESKRDKYIMIKNGMMQKLLTGKIRVK